MFSQKISIFTVECPNCQSKLNFHGNEINETLKCKMCMSDFQINFEPMTDEEKTAQLPLCDEEGFPLDY